ncbi:hypothetical protein [Sinorhizobium fredii]|uniref:hypothetical protein n=1 Tax=Rhizobium fredii TaxID=380 RepID=UPI0004B67EB0|nr:hypothetical protein [Sinorhizobium fredii]
MADTAELVYRDFVTDGVPSSGPNRPKKSEIRRLLTGYEAIINAFISSGGLIYSSKAALDADLAHAANSMAWVIGDPVAANNGVYGKVGTSGSGSWTRRSDLPFSFIIASDVGAGTPNAIQATTSIPVSASALIWMNIFEANTASPVTVSFNGGSTLTIKTNSGADVTAGGLTAGMIVMGIVSGSTFRLVSDQASSAVLAAAEAAKAAAEAAAVSVNIKNVATRTALKALNTAVTTLAFLGEGGRKGLFKWTTGDFSSQITADTQEGIYIKADAIASTVGAWVRQFDGRVFPEWFGAVGDGTTSDQTAAAAAVASAFASGDDLYWTNTYSTTASIANFHSVRHFGPGIIKREGLDVDIVGNGDFSSSTGWTFSGGATISGGTLNFPGVTASATKAIAAIKTLTTYEITYTIISVTAGNASFRLDGSSDVIGANRTAPGTYTERLTSNATTTGIQIVGSATFNGVYDNLTVREVVTSLFAVDPEEGQSNTVYVAATGDNASDGLSLSQPRASLQGAFDALNNYGPVLEGTWTINVAAGTYNSASNSVATLPAGLRSREIIEVVGPSVGGHPNVPTAVFDGASAATVGCRLFGRARMRLKDLKFQNYGSNTCITATEGSLLALENVHINTLAGGVDVQRGCSLFVSGGIFTLQSGSNSNFLIRELFNVAHAIGYTVNNDTGSPVNGEQPVFLGAGTGRAISFSEGCTGHVDGDIDDFFIGLEVGVNSRAHIDSTAVFSNNQTAVWESSGGDAQADAGVTWSTGTADANTRNVVRRAFSTWQNDGKSVSWSTIDKNILPGISHTGNTTETFLSSTPLIAGEWMGVSASNYAGKTIRVRVHGSLTGTAGTKTLRWRIDGTDSSASGNNVGSAVMAAAVASNFVHTFTFHITGAATQRNEAETLVNGGAIIVGAGGSTVDLSVAADQFLKLTVQLGNSADALSISGITVDVQG